MTEFFLYLFASFLSGMITFLAPCTLPLLPAYLGFSARSERKKVALNLLFFTLGMASLFTLLGIASGSLGNLVAIYKIEITFFSGILFVAFGIMSLLGKEFKLFNLNFEYKNTPASSFVFGSVFGLTWGGCIGPVLGFVLVLAANAGTAILGGIMLFAYSIGLIFPLILFSVFIDRLPKEGKVWKFLHGKLFEIKISGKTHYLHSTNLIAGVFFILFGLILIFNQFYSITKLFPDFTEFIFGIEDKLVEVFGLKL